MDIVFDNIRTQQKHETETVWNSDPTFVPLPGEVIIYDPDDNYDYQRIKIGDKDGTPLKDLPFINERITDEEIDAICV